MKGRGYVRIISSVDSGTSSILELNIMPGEKTPWHYHTLFSEMFEVLQGTLEVGKGDSVYQLGKGEKATIAPNEKHYYHNISGKECLVTTTIEPGNKNFEKAMFILKGLAGDGLAGNAGTPKRFSDLVLFVYLSNSRMTGIQKLAEPIFNWFAKNAIKKGQLDALLKQYYKSI